MITGKRCRARKVWCGSPLPEPLAFADYRFCASKEDLLPIPRLHVRALPELCQNIVLSA